MDSPPTGEIPSPTIDISQTPPPSTATPQSDSNTSTTTQTEATSPKSAELPNIQLGEDQLAQGKKWSEERIERRLRGQYERAGRALSELVGENLDTPLRLNAIRVVGAKATRPSFLSNLLAPSLPTLPPASYLSALPPTPSTTPPSTLRSILSTTRNLTGLLSQFDIFNSVEASLETSPNVLAEAEDVDIVFTVKEAPRFYLRTATDIGDGEGNATATARVRNAFGGAESLEGNVSFGTRTKSAFQLKLDTPVNGSPTTKAELAVFSAERDLNYFASCRESTRGAAVKLATISRFGLHEVVYEAVLRTIGNVAPIASVSIREAAGNSIKSSLSHVVVRDTRDDPVMATVGSYMRLKQEYAGLGGEANFVKLDNEAAISRAIYPGFTVSLGLRSGALYPLGGNPSLFADRFHIGGPTSVRMFRPNTMGPRDNGDFIGGDLHWETGLSLITPFPTRPNWPLKCHAFVNAGRLTQFDQTKTLIKTTSNLFSQPSVTAGFGLLYRHSLVRVEANFGVPLAMTAQEGAVRGLQFGLGMSFL